MRKETPRSEGLTQPMEVGSRGAERKKELWMQEAFQKWSLSGEFLDGGLDLGIRI